MALIVLLRLRNNYWNKHFHTLNKFIFLKISNMKYNYLLIILLIFAKVVSQNSNIGFDNYNTQAFNLKANELTYFNMLYSFDNAKKNIEDFEKSNGNLNYDFSYKSLSSFEKDYQKWKKIRIASKFIYLMNINPFSESKNYFELYWKRTAESFDFYDPFYLREYYGHSYRDRFDYSYSYFKLMNEQFNFDLYYYDHPELIDQKVSDIPKEAFNNDKYFCERYDYYNEVKRSKVELIIENLAMLTPLAIYCIIIFLFFKLQYVKNILNKFIFFGYKKNIHLTNKLKLVLKYLLVIISLFFIYDIIDNLRLIPKGYGVMKRFYTPNGILEQALESPYLYDDINKYAQIKEGWHFVLFKYMFLVLFAYVISIIFSLNKMNLNNKS